MRRCLHCGAVQRRPAYLVQRDFEAVVPTLGLTEQQLYAKSIISGRSLHRYARERWLIAYFLWSRGAHESDIAPLVGRERTNVLYAVRQVTRALKGSHALWWRSVLDRMEAALTGIAHVETALEQPAPPEAEFRGECA